MSIEIVKKENITNKRNDIIVGTRSDKRVVRYLSTGQDG